MSAAPNREPTDADRTYQKLITTGLSSIQQNCINVLKLEQELLHRMPESKFRDHLLPTVRNWVTGKEDGQNVRLWIAIAGHPEREILVVDDRDPTKLLFVCPPPFASIPMNTMDTLANGRTLGAQDLLEHQSVAITNGETRRIMDLENQFISIFSPTGAVESKNKHLLNLMIIWTRYNLDLHEILGEHTDEILAMINKESGDGTTTAGDSPVGNEDEEDDSLPIIV